MLLGLDTPLKQGIFAVYVLLWVSLYLLIYGSQLAGAPEYNKTLVVLLTELAKLCLACGLYLRFDGGTSDLIRAVVGSVPLLLRYTVPALLYCVYNNLVYLNLQAFDPGTYNVLMQTRIILTGLVWQALFAKRLNRNQWVAIASIGIGCMVKESSKLTAGGGAFGAALATARVEGAFGA